MNLAGVTNAISVRPRAGVTTAQAQRALFTLPGVGSVQPVSALTDSVRSQLGRMLDLLTIVEGAVLLLALLIAFNSSSINADERRRENATMFAFGLPVRSVVRMEVVESIVIGGLGTLVGLALGRILLGWLVGSLLPETFPDIGVVATVSTATLVTAVVLGVVAVGVAPLFTVRKLRRMDIPSTLRVVE
jgi:putative ABC transport system permease protein